MANGLRGSVVNARRPSAARASLRIDPTLPHALVGLVLAAGDAGTARRPRPRANDARRRPLPSRLPSAIATEVPPNILYRRYPLVTSLLVELDELRRAGIVPPSRRNR
ncbi:hypothetical protein KF840_23150 [bacterium]|nr:hypothetical protein [bacterium]